MKTNIGKVERFLRAAVGIILILLVFFGPKSWWGLLGVPLLASAFLGY